MHWPTNNKKDGIDKYLLTRCRTNLALHSRLKSDNTVTHQTEHHPESSVVYWLNLVAAAFKPSRMTLLGNQVFTSFQQYCHLRPSLSSQGQWSTKILCPLAHRRLRLHVHRHRFSIDLASKRKHWPVVSPSSMRAINSMPTLSICRIGYQIIIAAGCGMSIEQCNIAAQAALSARLIPAGTSVIIFIRALGSSVGSALGQTVSPHCTYT